MRPCCIEKQGIVDECPSPSAYNVKVGCLGTSKKGFSLKSRHEQKLDSTPGAQDYVDHKQFGDYGPHWTIAPKLEVHSDCFPAPGQYTPSIKIKREPAYTMRSKTGRPLFYNDQINPGCNSYFPKFKLSNVATSLKGRYKESKALKTPGPANYIIPIEQTGAQFTMTPREDLETLLLPGPAEYTINNSHDGPKYSLRPRVYVPLPKTCSPGPMYYSKQGFLEFNESAKISMKPRLESKLQKTPGPGDYNLPQVFKKFTQIPKSESSKTTKIPIPGPNAYDLEKGLKKIKVSTPSYSIAGRHSAKKEKSSYPAPNAYKVTLPRSARAASIKGKASNAVLVFPTNRQNIKD